MNTQSTPTQPRADGEAAQIVPPFIRMSDAVRRTLNHMLRVAGYDAGLTMREWALGHIKAGRMDLSACHDFRAAAEECGMKSWGDCTMGELASHPKFNTRNYAIR